MNSDLAGLLASADRAIIRRGAAKPQAESFYYFQTLTASGVSNTPIHQSFLLTQDLIRKQLSLLVPMSLQASFRTTHKGVDHLRDKEDVRDSSAFYGRLQFWLTGIG